MEKLYKEIEEARAKAEKDAPFIEGKENENGEYIENENTAYWKAQDEFEKAFGTKIEEMYTLEEEVYGLEMEIKLVEEEEKEKKRLE